MLYSMQTLVSSPWAAAKNRQSTGNVQTAPSLLGLNIQLRPSLHADAYEPRFSGDETGEPSTKKQKKEEHPELRGVTDPDERRKIQNRLAQRTFRKKAAEKKETEARDAQNQDAVEAQGQQREALHNQHQQELTAKYFGMEYRRPVTSYAGGFIAFPEDEDQQ